MKKISNIKSEIIKSKDGNLIKILSKKNLKNSWKFGEIYISNFKKNIIKNWNFHKFQTSSLFVLKGKVKIVIFDKKKFKVFNLEEKIQKLFYSRSSGSISICRSSNLLVISSLTKSFNF